MSTSGFPLIQTYRPATFRERGVAMPFTSPRLAGARVRPAERTGTEFVVPNPSGGRGVYVLHWGGVRQLCAPTVHDTLLHQRVARLPVMDPGGVRAVARVLAAEGMAGKDAALAALATQASDRDELVLVNFLLLITLMEQVEPSGLRVSAATERTPELDLNARRIVSRVGRELGRGTARIGGDLESLSLYLAAIGLDADAPPARLPRLAARLDKVAAGVALFADRCADEAFRHLAGVLARGAGAAAVCAASTIAAARATTHDMRGLLRAWADSPTEIGEQLSRPEWVLDGWERFCLLWETAPTMASHRAALLDMAQAVPVSPVELSAWNHDRPDIEARERLPRAASERASGRASGPDGGRDGGRAAQAFGLIARNESLQALLS